MHHTTPQRADTLFAGAQRIRRIGVTQPMAVMPADKTFPSLISNTLASQLLGGSFLDWTSRRVDTHVMELQPSCNMVRHLALDRLVSTEQLAHRLEVVDPIAHCLYDHQDRRTQ